MKKLNLRIDKKHFQAILDGKQKEEVRLLTPDNTDKYVTETELPDGQIKIDPIPYDVIQFFNGRRKDAARMTVKVADAIFRVHVDEEGNDITYEQDGEVYVVCDVQYILGEILETAGIGD